MVTDDNAADRRLGGPSSVPFPPGRGTGTVSAADALRLNPKVSLRPEPFGALAYHFGNRRLSFLKEPALVAVVRALESHESVLDALLACDVPETKHAAYLKALGSLVDSDMVLPRSAA